MRCLQCVRHEVEARRQLAELVIRIHRQAGAELALAQPGLGLLQARHGVDDQQIACGHEGHGGNNGQRHHEQLEQVQRRRPARNLDLDGIHKTIDLLHKRIGLRQGLRAIRRQWRHPATARLGPLGPDGFKARAGLVAPGHKQRA